MPEIISSRYWPLRAPIPASTAELFEQIRKPAAFRARPAGAKQIAQIIDVEWVGLRPRARRVSPTARTWSTGRGSLIIAAELIVALALVVITQRLEGLLHLLKLLFCRGIIRVHVGMILARELAISLL